MNWPGDSVVKNPPTNAGDSGSIPGSGKSPGEGNGTHSSIFTRKNLIEKSLCKSPQRILLDCGSWGRKGLHTT